MDYLFYIQKKSQRKKNKSNTLAKDETICSFFVMLNPLQEQKKPFGLFYLEDTE